MSALRRLSHVISGGGDEDGGAPDEGTPHRLHHHHRHLHHHHHDKKDYTVSPTGGNIPIKIPSEEEAPRHHRHRRRRATTTPAPQGQVPRPLRVIDPEYQPKKNRLNKRSSVSSNGTTSSGSSVASSGGIEIQGDRRNHGESPPPTPLIKTTPPTPSPLEQARRTNSQPVYRPPPPYPVNQDGAEYIAFSPASNMPFQDGAQKRHSGSAVPRRFPPHPGAVEIGSSDSIVQEPKRVDSSSSGASSPKSSTVRLDEKKGSKSVRRSRLANHRGSIRENQYDFLKTFDTVFVVDDSASMAGEYWDQLGQALETIATIATRYDSDGIDIHFLNAPQCDRKHVTSPATVRDLFNSVQPAGITPTGACLDRILREYLDKYADAKAAYTPSTTSPGPHPTMYASLPKPLNIIVLTDGEPTDDPESVIVAAARNLDRLNAPLHQVGIQFVQIGNEEGAREALEELDDALEEIYGVRDMVDFTPFVGAPGPGGGRKVSGEMILKALLGAVNRRYDRWGNDF